MKEIKYRCRNCSSIYWREEIENKENIEQRLRVFSGCSEPDLEEVGSRV
jgi:hypothetical protein